MNSTTRRRRSFHAGSSRGRQAPANRMPLPTDFQTTQPSKDGVIYQFKGCGHSGAIRKTHFLVTLAEKLRPSQQLGCHCHSTLILEPTAPTAGPHQALWPQQSIHIVYPSLGQASMAPLGSISSHSSRSLVVKPRPSQHLGCPCYSTLILEPTAPTVGPYQALQPQQSIHIVYLYLWEESTPPWVPSPATAAVQPNAIRLFKTHQSPKSTQDPGS